MKKQPFRKLIPFAMLTALMCPAMADETPAADPAAQAAPARTLDTEGVACSMGCGQRATPELTIIEPDPEHHVINIRREAKDAKERNMIAIAEAAKPQVGQWWNQDAGAPAPAAKDPMMAPQALTADALAYYEDRINSYRATTFTVPLETPMTHGDEVRSSLEYTATVNAEDHLKVGDVEYKNVFVVNLALSFVARQCEGAPFRAIALSQENRTESSKHGGP